MAQKTKNKKLTQEEIDQCILEGVQIAQLAMALPLKPEVKAEFFAALQELNYEQLQDVRRTLQAIGRQAVDTVVREEFASKINKILVDAKKDAQDLVQEYSAKVDDLVKSLPVEDN